MFWDKSGDMFHCLPLMNMPGEKQLQFMYDSASLYEEPVNINMLTANYAFLRSTSCVNPIMDKGKQISMSEVESRVKAFSVEQKASCCDELLLKYCGEEVDFKEICSCCPISRTYKNANRDLELKLVAYLLSNGGPMEVNMDELGIEDIVPLLNSLELLPFGKIPNRFVPFPLFQKICELMYESAFACVSADAFWESFSGVIYSRKAKPYKYGKLDTSSLSYVKNLVYSLFDESNKNIDIKGVIAELKSASVEQVVEQSSEKKPISKPTEEIVKTVVSPGSVILDDLFDEPSVLYTPMEELKAEPVEVSVVKSSDEPTTESNVESEPTVEPITEPLVELTPMVESVEEKAAIETVVNESPDIAESVTETVDITTSFVPVSSNTDVEGVSVENSSTMENSGAKDSELPETIIAGAGLPISSSMSIFGKSLDQMFVKKSSAVDEDNYTNRGVKSAGASFMYNGLLFTKKGGDNEVDVLTGEVVKPMTEDTVEPIEDSVTNVAASTESKVAPIINEEPIEATIFDMLAEVEDEVAVSKVDTIESTVVDTIADKVEDTVKDSIVDTDEKAIENTAMDIAEVIEPTIEPTTDMPSISPIVYNAPTVPEVVHEAIPSEVNEEVIVNNDELVSPNDLRMYTEYVKDGVIEQVKFRYSTTLSIGKVLKLSSTDNITIVTNVSDPSHIKFCRQISSDDLVVPLEVVSINDEVGLLIYLKEAFFVKYDSDAYGMLHTLFNNAKVTKVCYDAYTLAAYVYMYDNCLNNVIGLCQLYENKQLNVTSIAEYKAKYEEYGAIDYSAYVEAFSYSAAHALSLDAGYYLDCAHALDGDGFHYKYGGPVGKDFGVVFEISGLRSDVDSGIKTIQIVRNAVRVLYQSHLLQKYDAKIVEVSKDKFMIYVARNVYEFLDALIVSMSASIKKLTGGVPSFSCVPHFVHAK